MLNQNTLSKLNDMRLTAMSESYQSQMGDASYSSLSFEERFGLLVDIEWSRRKNNQLDELIRNADFNITGACIENLVYHADRKLDKELILRLASCNYIQEKHNVMLRGASGNGKTYLACALGIAACRNFYTIKYIRLPDLLNELSVARGEGIFKKVIGTYKKVGLLILDEWLLVGLRETEARDLLEIVEARHHKGSTIFCSQFAPQGWHEKIGESTMADAILDRIIYDSFRIQIHGKDSMRKLKGLKG